MTDYGGLNTMTPPTPLQPPIEWKLDDLTVKDFIDISNWYNSTDIPGSLASLMITAQSCTDTPLSLSTWGATLKSFIDAVTEYQHAKAKAKYERRRNRKGAP
jgi:hypothetical protein